jgi:cytolysin-activating lysine-acyltransferase
MHGVTDGDPAAPELATAGTAPRRQPDPNPFASAVLLMSRDARHRHLFLADLEWALLPPLALKQVRLFRKDDRPVAFATWAFVSEEVEARLAAGHTRLKPEEWKSGDRCWIVDVVAPFGGADEVVKTLKDTVLEEHEVRVLQQNSRP